MSEQEPEWTTEWAVDFSEPVGRGWRDGWQACGDRHTAERFAARVLDGKVLHRRVTRWSAAAPDQAASDGGKS